MARLLRLRSDDQLVALFRLGNEEAFDVIHDRYRARLLAYSRQMLAGSRSDAEDALQDVFLRAYGALRADDRPVTLRAWLYRVAHNRCIDALRRPASGASGAVELSEHLPATGADPGLEAERREDLRQLVADVRGLPTQQRSALLMREMEGLSYEELAGALEVSVPAVKSLLVRARMGLVDARSARDTACRDICDDLAGAHARGVKASGRSRRHLRECSSCRDYRTALKGVERGLAALAPSPGPVGLVLKALGLGGAGSGGAAAAGGGAAGVASTGSLLGGATAATTAKLAAVVAAAALVGGGAAEVSGTALVGRPAPRAHHAAAKRPTVAAVGAAALRAVPASLAGAPVASRAVAEHARVRAAAVRRRGSHATGARADRLVAAPVAQAAGVGQPAGVGFSADAATASQAGGALAPAEEADVTTTTTPAATTTTTQPDAAVEQAPPPTAPTTAADGSSAGGAAAPTG